MTEKIKYKGKDLPVRISYYAIKHFQQETKKTVDEIDEDISLMEVLFWYALEAGCKVEGIEVPIEREEVELVLDESMNDFLGCFGNFFQGQQVKEQDQKVKE